MKLPGFLAQPLAVPSQTWSAQPADLSHVLTLLRVEDFSGCPSGLLKGESGFALDLSDLNQPAGLLLSRLPFHGVIGMYV